MKKSVYLSLSQLFIHFVAFQTHKVQTHLNGPSTTFVHILQICHEILTELKTTFQYAQQYNGIHFQCFMDVT